MNRHAVSLLRLRFLPILGIASALAIVATISASTPALAWGAGSFSSSDEALLLSLTNQDRASAGKPALTNDSYLHKEAEWRAKDMGDRNYFSHKIPPSNTTVFVDMQKDKYCFKVAGENIGLSTYGDDAATTRIETAFMGSPSHRANILGTWSRIGVGAYKAADGRKLYAVLFSIPCSTVKPKTAKPATTAKGVAVASKPTSGAVASPTTSTQALMPSPTALPAATPAPTAEPVPTPAPTPALIAAATPARAAASLPAGTTLRVKDKNPPSSPLQDLFDLLFAGFFG
jgi:uncharacterized protein YkwD